MEAFFSSYAAREISFQMWPSHRFEFDTPDLNVLILFIANKHVGYTDDELCVELCHRMYNCKRLKKSYCDHVNMWVAKLSAEWSNRNKEGIKKCHISVN